MLKLILNIIEKSIVWKTLYTNCSCIKQWLHKIKIDLFYIWKFVWLIAAKEIIYTNTTCYIW